MCIVLSRKPIELMQILTIYCCSSSVLSQDGCMHKTLSLSLSLSLSLFTLVAGIMDKENSNAKLVPILAVTIIVAIVVLLAVVLVAVLSRRYSKRRKSSTNLFSHNQSFTASSR